MPNCLYATDRCLNVIGKSVATVDTPGVTTYSWEKSGYGLDAWAAGEPLLYPQSVPGISKFASQDGSGGGGSPQPWRCNADPNFGGTVEKLRRWEMGGYKTNGVYTNAKMATHAWEGGRSGYDCELLAFKDNKVGQMFGNYFSISIGPGYTQQ